MIYRTRREFPGTLAFASVRGILPASSQGTSGVKSSASLKAYCLLRATRQSLSGLLRRFPKRKRLLSCRNSTKQAYSLPYAVDLLWSIRSMARQSSQ